MICIIGIYALLSGPEYLQKTCSTFLLAYQAGRSRQAAESKMLFYSNCYFDMISEEDDGLFSCNMIFLSGRLSMKSMFLVSVLVIKHNIFYYLPMLSLGAQQGKMRVHYGKYCSRFSYFATYFTSLYVSEIIANYEKREKYLLILHG